MAPPLQESFSDFYWVRGDHLGIHPQIAERLIVVIRLRLVTSRCGNHTAFVMAYPLRILNESFLDGTAASQLIINLVMPMERCCYPCCSLGWINADSEPVEGITPTQRHALNAATWRD